MTPGSPSGRGIPPRAAAPPNSRDLWAPEHAERASAPTDLGFCALERERSRYRFRRDQLSGSPAPAATIFRASPLRNGATPRPTASPAATPERNDHPVTPT